MSDGSVACGASEGDAGAESEKTSEMVFEIGVGGVDDGSSCDPIGKPYHPLLMAKRNSTAEGRS